MLPWDLLRDSLHSINKLYKGLFNGFQELGDINQELAQLEAGNKSLLLLCQADHKYSKFAIGVHY